MSAILIQFGRINVLGIVSPRKLWKYFASETDNDTGTPEIAYLPSFLRVPVSAMSGDGLAVLRYTAAVSADLQSHSVAAPIRRVGKVPSVRRT